MAEDKEKLGAIGPLRWEGGLLVGVHPTDNQRRFKWHTGNILPVMSHGRVIGFITSNFVPLDDAVDMEDVDRAIATINEGGSGPGKLVLAEHLVDQPLQFKFGSFGRRFDLVREEPAPSSDGPIAPAVDTDEDILTEAADQLRARLLSELGTPEDHLKLIRARLSKATEAADV